MVVVVEWNIGDSYSDGDDGNGVDSNDNNGNGGKTFTIAIQFTISPCHSFCCDDILLTPFISTCLIFFFFVMRAHIDINKYT